MNHHSVSPQASPHAGWVVNLLFAFCVLTLNFSVALAGTFNVSPVKITLSKNSSTAIITVSNSGNSDTTIQLQTMRWIQDGEGDRLQPTREIIATPQIFAIKAGATQLIWASSKLEATIQMTSSPSVLLMPSNSPSKVLAVSSSQRRSLRPRGINRLWASSRKIRHRF